MEVMLRSWCAVGVGVAMLMAMVLAPLTHLHVGQEPHRHAEGATHQHIGRIHTHLTAHEVLPSSVQHGTRFRDHDHGSVVSLDTLLTEPGIALSMFVSSERTGLRPELKRSVGWRLLREPRAHGPPLIASVFGRAPPA
jgi:hypothetical protein